MVKKRVDERLVKLCRIVTAHQRKLDPVFGDAPILMLGARSNAPLTLQVLDKPPEGPDPICHLNRRRRRRTDGCYGLHECGLEPDRSPKRPYPGGNEAHEAA